MLYIFMHLPLNCYFNPILDMHNFLSEFANNMWSITTLESFTLMITLVLFMLLICILLSSFSFIKINSQTRNSINLPPCPPNKLPIIGHLHQLGPLPHHSFQTLAQKNGPLMLLHLGLSPILVVSSSEAAKEIMKTHDLIFSNRPNHSFAEKLFYGRDLAFTSNSEYCKQMRRICIYQLLSEKSVQSFRSIREQEVKFMIQKIVTSASNSSKVVDLVEMVTTLTTDLICRVAFGKKYSGETAGKRFGEILGEVFYCLGAFNVKDFIPWLGWINHFNGLYVRVEKCFRATDCFLEGVIEDHIENKKKREGSTESTDDQHEYKEDLVDVLLGINANKENSSELFGGSLDRDSIKGIILDMFAAGTDTSNSVLEWAMAELMRHPKVRRQVQEEVREIAKGKVNVTEDDLHKMHYLQCIIKETLRLHPPAPLLLPRESTEVSKIQGYDIPAKTIVIINAYAIARDPESWKEPNKFEPERFMNSSVDFKGHDFEFIPFGAGRRGCPGLAFATATIELALANLLFRFDWKLPVDANRTKAAGDHEGDIDMADAPGLLAHRKSPLLLVATDHFYYNK